MDEAIAPCPEAEKGRAVLPLPQLWQQHFGFVRDQAVIWFAKKLRLQTINIFELVSFYPMFREQRAGKTHIRVCRTLSCAMAGSYELMDKFCAVTGIVRKIEKERMHTPLSGSPHGNYSVEFVESLATSRT